MIFEDSLGRVFSESELNGLSAIDIEQMGIHVIDDSRWFTGS